MIRIPFEPYDKVRFGVPWCGVVMRWGAVLPKDGVLRPPVDLIMYGLWRGTAKKGGVVIMPDHELCPPRFHPARCPSCLMDKPGTVLRWGQRNRATGRTMNDGYGIVTSPSTFKQVSKWMAWQWYVSTCGMGYVTSTRSKQ